MFSTKTQDPMTAPTVLATYPQQALRTEKPLPTALARLRHAALGLITETGEIATVIKRIAIYGKALDDVNQDGKTLCAHLAEEIGDVLWYLAIAADAIGDQRLFANVLPTMPPVDMALNEDMLADGALVLGGVVGRFCDAVENNALADLDTLLRELGTVLVDLAAVIGIPLEQIAAANIAKLRARFPDAYSNHAAEARADKGGLDARHS